MPNQITREDIELACKVLAAVYCDHKDILPKDDKFDLCHAHNILETLAKRYAYKQTHTPEPIDIDINDSWAAGSVVTSLIDQNNQWDPNK